MSNPAFNETAEALDSIGEVGDCLSRPTLAECLDSFADYISRHLGAKRVSIFLRDSADSTEMFLCGSHGIDENIHQDMIISNGTGVAKGVVHSGETVVVNQAVSSSDRYRSGSYIVAPIHLDDSVFGVICVTERTSDASYTDADKAHIEALAKMMVMPIRFHRQGDSVKKKDEQIARILSTLPIGVLHLNGSGAVVGGSDKLKEMFDLTGTPKGAIEEVFDSDDAGPLRSMHIRLINDREVCTESWSRYVKDTKIDLRATALPSDDSHDVLILVEDVSLNRIVDELRHLDDLKRDFISMVSHELRTPITSVKGAASLLLGFQTDGLSDNQLNMLRIIENNISRLSEIVNKIVDVSLLEKNNVELIAAPGDLEQILEDLVERHAEEIKSQGLVVIRTYEENARRFDFDGERLYQAIDAVLHNAVKFNSAGGTITVETWRSGSIIHLRIRDEGEGIPREYRHLVFQKFFQIEEALTRKRNGAGLGLFFARKIARLHGGDLVIQDSERGATLEFTFTCDSVVTE